MVIALRYVKIFFTITRPTGARSKNMVARSRPNCAAHSLRLPMRGTSATHEPPEPSTLCKMGIRLAKEKLSKKEAAKAQAITRAVSPGYGLIYDKVFLII